MNRYIRSTPRSEHRRAHRILESLIDPDTGCWEWQYATTEGYGRIKIDGHLDMAHRVSYRLFVGPLDDSLHIDHLCHNRVCVNPHHLEAVTQAENNRRQFAHLQADLPGMSVSDAAERLNVGRNHVYRLARHGRLPVLDVEGRWLRLDPDGVERYAATTARSAA